ncbi:Calcium uniporter protein 1 [Nymphaea thermarum]|nr:Calcium uniporter protein 1 [Nymphaea thermarum]
MAPNILYQPTPYTLLLMLIILISSAHFVNRRDTPPLDNTQPHLVLPLVRNKSCSSTDLRVARVLEGVMPEAWYGGDKARRSELEAMEREKEVIDAEAEKGVRRELWGGLAYLVVQTAHWIISFAPKRKSQHPSSTASNIKNWLPRINKRMGKIIFWVTLTPQSSYICT